MKRRYTCIGLMTSMTTVAKVFWKNENDVMMVIVMVMAMALINLETDINE